MRKIQLKGKDYPCRVTMGAMVRFKRETGKDVSQLEKDDICGLVQFMHCCVVSACAADGTEFPYNFEQFADLLEPSGVQGFYDSAVDAQKKTMEQKA